MSSTPSLTTDAGVALGIAATAMPFTRTPQEQIERWLRVFGVEDEVRQPPAVPLPARQVGPEAAAKAGEDAAKLARRRGAECVSVGDIVLAVSELYGPAFEQALDARGLTLADVLERLR